MASLFALLHSWSERGKGLPSAKHAESMEPRKTCFLRGHDITAVNTQQPALRGGAVLASDHACAQQAVYWHCCAAPRGH